MTSMRHIDFSEPVEEVVSGVEKLQKQTAQVSVVVKDPSAQMLDAMRRLNTFEAKARQILNQSQQNEENVAERQGVSLR